MKHLVLTLALLPTLVMAHNIKESTQVPLVIPPDVRENRLQLRPVSTRNDNLTPLDTMELQVWLDVPRRPAPFVGPEIFRIGDAQARQDLTELLVGQGVNTDTNGGVDGGGNHCTPPSSWMD